MEATIALYITLCATVILPMSEASSIENSQTCSMTTTPPIGCVLPMNPESSNHMDLICSVSDTPETCGKVYLYGFVFNVSCDGGYITGGADVPALYTLSLNGTWTPRVPECRRGCKPLKSFNMDIRCQHNGREINCNKAVPIGTEATGRCKMGYLRTEKPADATVVCKENGDWSNDLFDCITPACGRKNPTDSVSPWLVAVYRHDELQCMGILISPHAVVSHDGCASTGVSRNKPVSPQELVATVGKKVTKHRDRLIAAVHVQDVSTHPNFFGKDTHYAFNIALIDLETSVSNTPACVDWDLQFDITPGQRTTMEILTDDNKIIYAQQEYMDYVKCVSVLKPKQRHDIASDKFCSRFVNEAEQSAMRYGSGWMVENNSVYYVKGLLSGWLPSDMGRLYCIQNLGDASLLRWLHQTMT